jgi:hypothetical protein
VRRRAALLLGVAALACAACGPEAESPARGEDETQRALEQQLEALGYVTGSEPRGPQRGVVAHDASRVQPGLNFYTSGHEPGAVLMDLEGRVLHTWSAGFEQVFGSHPAAPRGVPADQNFWRHAQLLPGGEVLAVWERLGIFKLDRDSNVLWARPNQAHHDFFVTGTGDIYALVVEANVLPAVGEREAYEDFIVLLDAEGVERRRLSLADALANARWPQLRRRFWRREQQRKHGLSALARFDPFHTNALWRLSSDEAERLGAPFAEGQLLVSMAMLDTIAAVDFEAGHSVWWQTGPFGLQHQPRPTRSGGIVLFNNHLTRDRSSVQVLDPHTGKVSWEFSGSDGDPLFSRTSAGAEELANGNFLVVESNRGRVLEVTPEREVVWEFHNPRAAFHDDALVATVYFMDRVPATLWSPAAITP